MSRISAIALFCDDIRHEASGEFSLMGVHPDTMLVPGVPGMLPKLAIYMRAHVPLDVRFDTMHLYIKEPGGARRLCGQFEADMIEGAQQQATDAGLRFAGLINVVVASPFLIEQPGKYAVELDYDGVTQEMGALTVAVDTSNDTPSAPPASNVSA